MARSLIGERERNVGRINVNEVLRLGPNVAGQMRETVRKLAGQRKLQGIVIRVVGIRVLDDLTEHITRVLEMCRTATTFF